MVANFDGKRPGLTNAYKTPGIAVLKVLALKYVGGFTDESCGFSPAFSPLGLMISFVYT